MSPERLDESAFRHLMRVRLGVHGAKGRLMRCTNREGKPYWRVKLSADKAWVYPYDIVIDGEGDCVARCGDCGLRFISDGQSPLCRYCSPAAFGAPSEIRRPSAYFAGRRMSTAGTTPVAELTEQEQADADAEAARLRHRDEQIYPF
jgi:hypothetical protein